MTAREVLFISGDIGGNVPPTLAIAGELAKRGHRVTVAGLHARAGDRWPTGVEAVPLPALRGLDVTRRPGPLGHMPGLARMALGGAVARDVRELLALRDRDAVVVDGVMLGSLREALRAGIPTAVLFHSLGRFWSRGMANPGANTLLRPLGLAPLPLLARADARLLPTDRDLDPAGDGTSPIAFDWIGTTEHARPPEPRAAGEPPLVLVSLSTAWQRRQGDVYRRIIAALASLADDEPAVHAIVTTGGAQLDGVLTPAPNVEIRGHSPHTDIMPRAALVIGHGGHSTTLRSLAHGVPLLILPLDPTSDQRLIGGVVESAGLGRMLPRRASADDIRDAIRGILADPEVATAATRTGERLRGQHGAEAGADRIEAIARTRE